MTPSVRVAAARTLLAVQSGRATLAAELDRARRDFPDERDRGLLMELTAGTLRWRGAIDAVLAPFVSRPFAEIHEAVLTVLRVGTYELRHLTRMPAHAVVNEAVESVRALRQGRAAGFVNAILRSVERKREVLTLPGRPTSDDREAWINYLSTSLSHPRWLAERYFDRAGAAGAEAWCRYNNAVPAVTVRVTAATNAEDQATIYEELQAAGGVASALTPGAWRLPAGAFAALEEPVRDQLVVQDEGSQLVAQRIAAAAGDRVLDLCAAPGGKSAMLARAVGPEGRVVSCDTRPARLKVLKETLAHEGAPVRVVRIDATEPLPFGPVFDRVLLDAPCSGLGTISRDPDVKWSRQPDALARFAATQRAMLEHGAAAVASGGRLVYATCSSEPEENAEVVASFLAAHPEFEREAPDLETRPDRDALDAFFAAVLVRRGPPS
jgi:16S rRNA (cytosine967-C5)-methyltransferase